MDPATIIRSLWDYGHFFSPEALAVDLVEEKNLDTLTLKDEVVRAALLSYQRFMSDTLSQFTMQKHLRMSIPDGDAGPATELLLETPRCAVPDFKHPMAAALEGNWPDQCRLELTTSYKMSLDGVTAEQIKALWIEADKNWENVIEIGIRLELDNYPNTSLFANAESMGGSVLAYQELARSSCSHRLHGAYNSRVNWSPPLLVTTITHEHGHGWGCDHVGDSQATMYPSITNASQARRGALNATDISQAISKGYKRRTTPIPPDEPPPTPPGEHRLYLASTAPIRIIPE